MTTSIRLESAAPLLTPDLRGAAMKKWLKARLGEFDLYLSVIQNPDPLTSEFIRWNESFKNALDLQVDPEVIRDQFLRLLQEHLSSLCTYIVAFRTTTLPSSLVRDLIQLLQTHSCLLTAEDLRLHKDLLDHLYPSPSPPPTREERLRAIRERSLAIEKERKRELDSHAVNIRREAVQEVATRFAPIISEMQQFAEEAAKRLEELRRSDQERLQAMQRVLGTQEGLKEMQRVVEANMTQRIESLEKGVAEIRSRNAYVNSQLSSLERDNQKLRIMIGELKTSMKKKEKEWVGPFFTTVAITGVCILGIYAFGGPPIFPFGGPRPNPHVSPFLQQPINVTGLGSKFVI